MLRKRLLSLAVVLLGWWATSMLDLLNPVFVPHLYDFATALVSVWEEADLSSDVAVTVGRAIAGVALSAVAGVPLGLILGVFHRSYAYVEFPLDFVRSVPASAVFFLFVLIFGLADAAKVAVVFYGCFPILVVSAVYGVRPDHSKLSRLRMLTSLKATRYQRLIWGTLPDALPQIVAGLRIAVSLALVLVIVTEMFLSSQTGLGRRLYDYYLTYRIPEMYAVLAVLGSVGMVLNWCVVRLERKFLFWTAHDGGS